MAFMCISAKTRDVRHTGPMRRGVWFVVLGLVLAALGAASAYAAGTATTTSTTTTTTSTPTTSTTTSQTTTTTHTTTAHTTTTHTTTTAKTTTAKTTTAKTTTTPPPPTYAPLAASYLAAGCVGAGAAAIAVPGRHVLTLGTPAVSRGPSAYPAKAPIVRFRSSTAGGSACTTAHVTLASVSLFGGAVTARSIAATHGRGTASGIQIYGSSVGLSAGTPVRVGGWGEMTLQKKVGRITAPLVVQLVAAHHGLPAGTTIALAFGASAQAHKPKHQAGGAAGTKRKHKPVPQPLVAVPSLGYKPSHYVFPIDGGASYVDTYGANRNDIYDGWHHGNDLFAPLGTPVVAVARGTLSLVGWNSLGGWRLWLTDRKGNSFYYAHLAGYARWILTHPHVRAGQVVGFLGRTGDAFTTAPHVHFEIHPHQPAFVKLGYDGAVDPYTYLRKWKIEKVPADEIPQPAKLKAPVGAPSQEAGVVWHELLVARHLLGLTTTGSTSSAKASSQDPYPLRLAASGVASLPVAALQTASAHTSESAGDLGLLVGGPLGGLLVLSAAAGAFTFRRRRRTSATAEPAPAPDASS
jgi:murein DD-endopeptidase MepM/ murein hydrolase activator NlpD